MHSQEDKAEAVLNLSATQVDRLGRKVLLIAGSIQGFLAEVAAAILLAVAYEGGQYIPQGPSIGMLVLICIFSISFGYCELPLPFIPTGSCHVTLNSLMADPRKFFQNCFDFSDNCEHGNRNVSCLALLSLFCREIAQGGFYS